MEAREKTYYIPYMCDHALILGAALQAFGLPTQVLPPSDDETLNLGLDSALGKECSPCFTTTGDLLRLARQPGFDPTRAIVFMPSAEGPCRFGQYRTLLRQVLDDHGLHEVEMAALSIYDSRGMGSNPTRMRILAWEGVVVTDVLQKLLRTHRPYELRPGQTDALYRVCLQRVVEDTQAGGGRRLRDAVKWIARRFEALPVDRSEPRPLIGLVGEMYLRSNAYASQDIIRQVEAVGGEVVVATMQEWAYFSNWDHVQRIRDEGQALEIIKTVLTDLYQRYREHRLVKPAAHLLRHRYEVPTARLMDNIRPYYEPLLSTEAVLTMGEAIELARHGASGILNILPFSCMPGIISAGMAPRIRADLDNIPWLDVVFDAQGGTNLHTRLEAFMYQAEQYRRRNRRHSS